jgi:hypothetical protein
MTFSKASIALLLRRLSVYHSSVFCSSTPIAGICIWAVFSLLASTFQCGLPTPWRATPSQCPARVGLLSTVGILNIITDAVLAVYIIPGVWRLESMAKHVRLTVIVLFATRLTVCVAAAIQVIRLIQFADSQDETCKYFFLSILSTYHAVRSKTPSTLYCESFQDGNNILSDSIPSK